jgi:hypothetical protein
MGIGDTFLRPRTTGFDKIVISQALHGSSKEGLVRIMDQANLAA